MENSKLTVDHTRLSGYSIFVGTEITQDVIYSEFELYRWYNSNVILVK